MFVHYIICFIFLDLTAWSFSLCLWWFECGVTKRKGIFIQSQYEFLSVLGHPLQNQIQQESKTNGFNSQYISTEWRRPLCQMVLTPAHVWDKFTPTFSFCNNTWFMRNTNILLHEYSYPIRSASQGVRILQGKA